VNCTPGQSLGIPLAIALFISGCGKKDREPQPPLPVIGHRLNPDPKFPEGNNKVKIAEAERR